MLCDLITPAQLPSCRAVDGFLDDFIQDINIHGFAESRQFSAHF